jgi:hypothetical protein
MHLGTVRQCRKLGSLGYRRQDLTQKGDVLNFRVRLRVEQSRVIGRRGVAKPPAEQRYLRRPSLQPFHARQELEIESKLDGMPGSIDCLADYRKSPFIDPSMRPILSHQPQRDDLGNLEYVAFSLFIA